MDWGRSWDGWELVVTKGLPLVTFRFFHHQLVKLQVWTSVGVYVTPEWTWNLVSILIAKPCLMP